MSKSNETVDTLRAMRLISNTTGVVYEFQAENLKKVSALFFGDLSVVISVITNSWLVIAQLPAGAPVPPNTDKFIGMVQSLLGDNWKVEIVNGKHASDSSAKSRRAGRARPVSKQSRRKRRTRS